MKKTLKTFMLLLLIAGVCMCSMPAIAYGHGTTTQTITEEMLVTTPDKDYKVNMDMQGDAKDGAYNAYFLKDSLQTVSIDIDENNLNYLLQNAQDKPTVMTNSVTIGDQKIGYAGLKTKGNYTLKHTYEEETNDRFSFTINFGKYIKKKDYGVKQNFYGCSKISFNNFYFDKSMMKEYFAMKLMSEMGVPTSQYGLAKLYINGQYYGVYFMVEPMESTIVEQYLNAASEDVSSFLTKPEGTKLQYNSGLDSLLKEDGTFDLSSVLTQNEKGDYEVKGHLEGQQGLWENDSDTLQDVADMLPTVLSWEKKLNQLSEGKDFNGQKIDVDSEEYIKLLDTIMDVDEALRYFATHSFLVQLDDMFVNEQNFGLYVDKNGRSLLLPWDYDLCFGCYYPGLAEITANLWLDLMYLDDGAMTREAYYSQYPIFNVLYQNTELLERYYSYMDECSKIVLLGGTLSDGKSYQPAYFTSYIDKMQAELEQAASEKLAPNVSYLQGVKQPAAMLLALPNLSQIMAMRSVSVYNWMEYLEKRDDDAYFFVASNGCNLVTLGNGTSGWERNYGKLAIVDDKTGLFVEADYGEEDVNRERPRMTFKKLSKSNTNYQAVKNATGCQNEDNLTVYKIDCNVTPVTKYMVTIPLERAYSADEIAVYSYTKDKTTKLNLKMDDNICSGKTGSIAYIAILKTAGETNLKEVEAEDDSVDTLPVESVQKTEKKVIALNKTTVTLKKGKTCQLKLKNAVKTVTWKSANKKIAKVSKKGKVTAMKKGTVWIKAVSGKKTYRCKVKVKN